MRMTITLIAAIAILALLNFSVWQKEKILNEGETVFFELAPVDPRSLMQGDYMVLAFAIERNINKKLSKEAAKSGHLIFKKNQQNIAEFIRFGETEGLTDNEYAIRYRKPASWQRPQIQPRSFFFQEGHRKIYEAAKYGVFKFNGPNDYLLTALADENLKIIKPETSE